jgi:putative membrane protein
MRTHRTFRAAGLESLEDRAVPSLFGMGGASTLPAKDAAAVQKAFQTFEQSYTKDVRTILFASGTTPSANLSAFNTAVGTGTGTPASTSALGTLETSINSAVANLSTASALTTQIDGELTTLQSNLTSITVPSTNTAKTLRTYLNQGSMDIQKTDSQVVQQVRSAPPPTGTISSATLQTALKAVNSAYQTFRQTFNSDVQAIEKSPGSTPETTYQSNVLTAVTTLNGSIDMAVGALGLPASQTTTLETTIQNDLLTGTSTTGTSLQGKLDALTVPTTTGFFSTLGFKLKSSLIILGSQGQATQAITSAVNQYNASLTG